MCLFKKQKLYNCVGYYSMTAAWFKEYMYQIVVKKEKLPDKMKDILKEAEDSKNITVLPPWDPMGSLARSC